VKNLASTVRWLGRASDKRRRLCADGAKNKPAMTCAGSRRRRIDLLWSCRLAGGGKVTHVRDGGNRRSTGSRFGTCWRAGSRYLANAAHVKNVPGRKSDVNTRPGSRILWAAA